MAPPTTSAAVLALMKDLSRARGDEDWERVADVLVAIRGLDMDVKLLQQTQIGKSVRPLRKAEDKRAQELATALIQSWRELSQRESQTGTSEAAAASRPAKQEEEKQEERKPHVVKIRLPKADPADVVESSAAAAAVYTTELPPLRTKSREVLRNTLSVDHKGGPLHSLAEEVEAAMHNWASEQDDPKCYQIKFRQLASNLKKNVPLRRRVVLGDVPPADLVVMTKEMLADENKNAERMRSEQAMRDQLSLDYSKRPEVRARKYAACGIDKVTSMEPCRKCGSKNVNNYERQTRSADEPMTQFYQCLDCEHQWRG